MSTKNLQKPRLKSDDFEFVAHLGTGTFGTVCIVKRLKDGKQFVIKQQELNSCNSSSARMISWEMANMQVLRHPNVVSYYGAWQEEQSFYILMEFASRGTLKYLLDKRSLPLEEHDAMYLFAQICLGVHHIHSKEILHRDLKPENIMLTGKMGDIVKIGDFGLSKDSFDDSPSYAGSYYYISPEMLRQESYDYKCDIWSMGVILYEMLTKQQTFPAESVNEIVQMVCNGKPRTFGATMVSREAKIMVYKMLQQDPVDRPTTRLLLLNNHLMPYVTKVYLNLGRAYITSDFGLETFKNYFGKPVITKTGIRVPMPLA